MSVTWKPGVADVCQHPITVQVTNSVGLTTTQTYALTFVAVAGGLARRARLRAAHLCSARP
jgi:hypothetical protein